MEADQIYLKSSEAMSEVEDGTVGLVVTSPPYNVRMPYGGKSSNDALSLKDYLGFMSRVFTECYRVLDWGGRLVINIANTGRRPYCPLTTYFTIILQKIGFCHRGIIVWDKGPSAQQRTSWGSFMSPSAPELVDVNEFILVFSKGLRPRRMKGTSTITSAEFLLFTKSIWPMQTASATAVGHPAPFPLELPERAIKLFSFQEDIVLDPFAGSGTTLIQAMLLGRKYIGYEIQESYVKLANDLLVSYKLGTR